MVVPNLNLRSTVTAKKYLDLLFVVLVVCKALIIMNNYTVSIHVELPHEGINHFPVALTMSLLIDSVKCILIVQYFRHGKIF